jgi:hypothetical protein
VFFSANYDAYQRTINTSFIPLTKLKVEVNHRYDHIPDDIFTAIVNVGADGSLDGTYDWGPEDEKRYGMAFLLTYATSMWALTMTTTVGEDGRHCLQPANTLRAIVKWLDVA